MSFSSFLEILFDHGRVRVAAFSPISTEDSARAAQVLSEFEPSYRASLPNSPPPFHLETALHASEVVYRCCQCLVYRDLSLQEVLPAQVFRPDGASKGTQHYSADLVFRFLPDVWRLAKAASESDPLVAYIRELGAQWPLSSIGITGIPECDVSELLADNSLSTLYVDRVLEHRDITRLGSPQVRVGIQNALGLFTELSPELSTALTEFK